MRDFLHSLPRLSFSYWLYVPLLLFACYLFYYIFDFNPNTPNNPILAAVYTPEYGIHEISHIVAGFLPQLGIAAAGSVGEILFTVLVLCVCIKYRAYFTSVFAGLWLMMAVHNTGMYMADSRSLKMEYLGPGGGLESSLHDWRYIFSYFNILEHDVEIGTCVMWVGRGIGTLAILWGILLIVSRFMRPNKETTLQNGQH